ncbi:MAG: AsmA family protein [Rhizorhabdus sp.]|nr:MAG: AsmA family protein [Rhizorhabdus sp.]
MAARRLRMIAVGAAGAALVVPLLLAAAPVSPFRTMLEDRMSAGFGSRVTIASLDRLDRFSFAPRVRIAGIVVAQPSWAGRGDMLRIDRLEVEVPVLPLLIGKVRPRAVTIDGVEADLLRSRAGRENWRGRSGGAGGAPPPMIAGLRDAHIRYRDFKRDRSLDVRAAIDGAGLRLTGQGLVRDAAVHITAQGGPMRPGRWPFDARLSGRAIDFHAAGTMDAPLDLSRLDARIAARADNLTYIDTIVEAGLPATQPVRLTATVRRDRPDWAVRSLAGTIGRSDIRGRATIRKRDGRHRIDASIAARRFDFDDLADARGRATAAAKRARFGKRLFPDTAIDLDNVARTDGRLAFKVDELLWPGPSPLRTLDGTLTIERSLLDLPDLRIGLTHGALAGRLTIDQRRGGPVLQADLRLRGARLADFAPAMGFDAPLSGRLKLEGPGKTIRSAVGRSTGRIALVARDGVLPDKAATLMGQELGGIFKSDKAQARLRCIVVRLDARDGIATANPIMLDSSRAVTRAEGRLYLADERLALSVQGTPKRGDTLRIAGTIRVGGTIKAPEVGLSEGDGVVGALLKSVGRALDGKAEPVAADQDCAGLAARAMAG